MEKMVTKKLEMTKIMLTIKVARHQEDLKQVNLVEFVSKIRIVRENISVVKSCQLNQDINAILRKIVMKKNLLNVLKTKPHL
jgi:hypothetical protein